MMGEVEKGNIILRGSLVTRGDWRGESRAWDVVSRGLAR